MTNIYQRETVEFQPVTVTLDGVAVTSNVTFCVTDRSTRPVTFATPTTVGDEIGVMVDTLDPGTYIVWAKVLSSPETPVINCGTFVVA